MKKTNKIDKIDKCYFSEIDKKLAEFDRSNPKSAEQIAEIEKHQRIFQMRDTAMTEKKPVEADPIWEDF